MPLPTHFLGVPVFRLGGPMPLSILESKCKSYRLYFSYEEYLKSEVYILNGTVLVHRHETVMVPNFGEAEATAEKVVKRIRDDTHALVYLDNDLPKLRRSR